MEKNDLGLLRFVRLGAKLYAETPSGEFQFGDYSGLNEWRDGRRIHYTGGDRQAADGGQWLQFMTNPETFAHGWSAALVPYYFETN
jgi:hypothetical protein